MIFAEELCDQKKAKVHLRKSKLRDLCVYFYHIYQSICKYCYGQINFRIQFTEILDDIRSLEVEREEKKPSET